MTIYTIEPLGGQIAMVCPDWRLLAVVQGAPMTDKIAAMACVRIQTARRRGAFSAQSNVRRLA